MVKCWKTGQKPELKLCKELCQKPCEDLHQEDTPPEGSLNEVDAQEESQL